MSLLIGIVIAAILFLVFERDRLRRLMKRWQTRSRSHSSGGGGIPRISARAQALVEFLEILLADVNAGDRMAWIAAAVADQPGQGDATKLLIASHLGLPGQTLRSRVLLALNSNSADALQPMGRDVAAGHGLKDLFEWDQDAPTNNTVIDGVMAFEQWLAPRGYALLYFESGFDVPTTFAVRASRVPEVLARAEGAGLRVLDGQAYRASTEGIKVLAAAARLRRNPAQNAQLADSLTSAGFFSGLPERRGRALADLIKRNGYSGVFKHDWRAFAADDEELTEGSVGIFLSGCATAFEHLGVPPLLGKDRFAEGGAHILDLASGSEDGSVVLLSEADGFHRAIDLVAARLISLMNRHLANYDLADRFYSVYSGNDAEVLLLSPAMLAVIESLPHLREEERPHWRSEVTQ